MYSFIFLQNILFVGASEALATISRLTFTFCAAIIFDKINGFERMETVFVFVLLE